jgi:hypothetical protein
MVLFLDESYEKVDQCYHLAVGGVMIPAHRYRHLLACAHRLKAERFFDGALAQSDRAAFDALRRTRVPVQGNPLEAEFKATKLLSPGAARHHVTVGPAPGFVVVAELLDELAGLEAVTFGTLSEVADVQVALHPIDGSLPRQYRFLLERANGYVERKHPGRVATVVLDTVHLGSDLSLVRRTSDFLFRAEKGRSMRNILPAPLCVDSASAVGVQIADLVVSLLRRAMAPAVARAPWQALIDKVYRMASRQEDGKIYSIYRIYRK